MKASFVFVGWLLLAAAVAQQHDEPRPNGVIYGIIIGQDGQPAKDVGLTASPLGVALATVLPNTRTKDKGEYRFQNIPCGVNTPFTLKMKMLDTHSSAPRQAIVSLPSRPGALQG